MIGRPRKVWARSLREEEALPSLDERDRRGAEEKKPARMPALQELRRETDGRTT
jgi:hypothetical protein